MGRNRVSDDLDHVADAPTTTKKSKNPPPKPKPIPRFNPMKINDLIHELDKLPIYVASTLYRVFSLFFIDKILHKLAEYTNEYATEYASKEDKLFARKWYPTSLQELRAYIATYIYMRIHSQSQVPDYWNRDPNKGPLHPLIYDHIALCRWQQIDRFLRISKPTSANPTIFDKLEELSKHLRHAFKQYWSIDTHLTVDESIQRFQGRFAVTINIPSKPVPKGYKIWILANAGYVLNWLFHAKNDKLSPIDLNDWWIKDEDFSKTQAVVLDLLTQQGIDNNNKHVVWLDNLFTSTRLLSVLRDLGFGIAGTVRVTKTKRDEYEEKHDTQAQKQQKKQNKELDTSLNDLKLEYGAQIEWGQLYEIISKDKKVAQFAWKDQQIVLFMSTIHTGRKTVETLRRKPAKTSTNARTSRAPFGDLTIKKLPIPDFIDLYNHFMNDVDVADQLRYYYDTQRVHLKTWKPLWHFLLNTTIVNSYKIINITELRPYAKLRKHDSHRLFRIKLIQELYDHFTRIASSPEGFKNYKSKKLAQLVRCAPPIEHGIRVQLNKVKRYCVPCSINHRIAQKVSVRKPLKKLSMNTILTKKRRYRSPKTNSGCKLCRMIICKSITCWREHLEACIASE